MEIKKLENNICNYLQKDYKNLMFTISGRSAIDFALKEALLTNPNLNVYVPTYVCDSMIKPFIDSNLPLNFYNILFDGKTFDIDTNPFKNDKNALVLYCDYFISNNQIYEKIAKSLKKEAILIHDTTHTLFSRNYSDYRDDYIVASLRKWFVTIDGGLCITKNIPHNKLSIENQNYIILKKAAYIAKENYHKYPSDENKKIYKTLSSLAEEELDTNYSLYRMSIDSIKTINSLNFNDMFDEKRKKFIIIRDLLKDYQLLEEASKENCIFTIPLVNLNNRDEIFDEMQKRLIRCAVMWDFGIEKIYQDFVDKSLCIDISDNTIKRLRKRKQK